MQEEHERPVGLPLPAFLFLPFGRLPLGPPQPSGVSLIKPTMARLTLARKIAAITLTLWKKGEDFDAEKLKSQAA